MHICPVPVHKHASGREHWRRPDGYSWTCDCGQRWVIERGDWRMRGDH